MNHSPEFTTPQRFEAASSREALRLAREQLGPDAMVMSSQVTATGVAIVAVAERPAVPVFQCVTQPAAANTDSVLREIHAMRGMIEEQLASLVRQDARSQAPQTEDPLRSSLLRVMLAAGLSPRLARTTLAQWSAAKSANTETLTSLAEAMAWLQSTLASQLPVLGDDEELMAAGGVYALVGPTGVGKTTTTAKLAARCVMRFGAQQLALVTTDTFRIGAVEQLRLYGEILGVPVYAVQGAAELDGLLTQLSGKHMVLIDTVGMSQRDRAVADQVALLSAPRRPVKRLLLLNAASHGDTLDEVVRAYQSVGASAAKGQGAALAGCIFTKVDEAVHSGALIDIAIREQLRVHYVANGQQVPEHLHLAGAQALVSSMLAVRAPSPWSESPPAWRSTQPQGSEDLGQSRSGQLLRALAHDSCALARTAAQLDAAQLGYAGTRARWKAITLQGESAYSSSVPDGDAGLPPEVREAPYLLAITGKSQWPGAGDSLAHSVLMLSARDGTPVLAPATWGPVGAEGLPRLQASAGLPPVIHVLPLPPRHEQVMAWAQQGVHWVAQASAAVRVKGVASTLAHVLKTACFGPAIAIRHRRKAAWQALAEVELELAEAGDGAQARLRCVIKRITDAEGKALSHSFVLCPLTLDVPGAQLVQWPVWRSEVEPYFKLLTQALVQPLVQPVHHPFCRRADASLSWQLAAQACLTVYRLQRLDADWAEAARKLLAQLAGRPVRPSQPVTGPTLLDGLGKFMALLDALTREPAAPCEELPAHSHAQRA